MARYDGFLPKEQVNGKRGYYPVTSEEQWKELPDVYKAMEWFPIHVLNIRTRHKEPTVAEYIEFDVHYLEPYKINATVKVHVQDVHKILFCSHKETQCLLYSISGVIFRNGERRDAKWMQDSITGAYEIVSNGKCIGKQGGYMGFIPSNIEKREDGFHWTGQSVDGKYCYYNI